MYYFFDNEKLFTKHMLRVFLISLCLYLGCVFMAYQPLLVI